MSFLNLLLHIDSLLAAVVHMMGAWSYVILFAIIFFERACILTPFLPGDSLLFAAGALSANSELHILSLIIILTLASFLGVLLNYGLGYKLGDYIHRRNPRWLNRTYLERAHTFFEKYGFSAILVCCFIPIIRTFTPFVAGMAKMTPHKYVVMSFLSSCLWIIGVLWISYAFGNIAFVKQHFSWLVLAMIIIPSMIPACGFLWHRYAHK